MPAARAARSPEGRDEDLAVEWVNARVAVFQTAFPLLCSMVLYWLVASRTEARLGTGEFLAFSTSFTIFLYAFLNLVATGLHALVAIPLYERAKPLLKEPPESAGTTEHRVDLGGEIEVSHASFRYDPSGPLILDDVSFGVEKGEFVALVGPSGSGKSTLLGADETTVQPGAGGALAVGLGEPARLEFGLRGMSDVGWAFDTWMRWLTVRSTPLGAGIELTTMPGNNANAALRLMLEIGRQLGRHVLVTLRGGYGARDLEGGGATLGGQVQVSL